MGEFEIFKEKATSRIKVLKKIILLRRNIE